MRAKGEGLWNRLALQNNSPHSDLSFLEDGKMEIEICP